MKKVLGIIAVAIVWVLGIVIMAISGGALGGLAASISEKIIDSTFGTKNG